MTIHWCVDDQNNNRNKSNWYGCLFLSKKITYKHHHVCPKVYWFVNLTFTDKDGTKNLLELIRPCLIWANSLKGRRIPWITPNSNFLVTPFMKCRGLFYVPTGTHDRPPLKDDMAGLSESVSTMTIPSQLLSSGTMANCLVEWDQLAKSLSKSRNFVSSQLFRLIWNLP